MWHRSRLGRRALVAMVMTAAAAIILAGCGSSGPTDGAEVSVETEAPDDRGGSVNDAASLGAATVSGPEPYLLFNQRIIEGISTNPIDIEDTDSVFWHVFSRLPDQVTVYPSENYYYFILHVEGREFWGNIRLPAGLREDGTLSFGYFEFDEFPNGTSTRFSRSKYYSQADGVHVREIDPFTYEVSYNARAVAFNLHRLPQDPPKLFTLGDDELFVERTFDESGYQFFLLFNERSNYFFWVLNEEEGVPDVLIPVDVDLLVGKRSGFGFWVDAAHDGRKVLAGIRRLNLNRNDYFDGPFDQLADNYAGEVGILGYIQRAYPTLQGRIDKYGYYTDTERPLRVALPNYYIYLSTSDLQQFVKQAKEASDPYQHISRRGKPVSS